MRPSVLCIPSLFATLVASLSLSPRTTFTDSDLTAASWIWAPEPELTTTAPPGTVGFLRTFTSPSGKTAAGASIAIAADNNFTVWVNGRPVGATNPGDGWQDGQALIASLNATTNTLSAIAVNYADNTTVGAATPAGLLAFVRVFYTDGSNTTFATDKSWQTTTSLPSDWPSPADTSKFAAAEVAFPYGQGPWGTQVTITQSDFTSDDLTTSDWLWSTPDAATSALAGSVGFRTTFASSSGKTPSFATVIASADNTFSFYLNGRYVSSPPDDPNTAGEAIASWEYASRVTAYGLAASSNTFDFFATNFLSQSSQTGSSAGFIAVIQITYTDGSTDTIRSDGSWLAAQAQSAAAFIAMGDSSLTPASSLGAYGMAPWGSIGVADTVDAARVFLSGDNVGNGSAAIANLPTATANTSSSDATDTGVPSFTFTTVVMASASDAAGAGAGGAPPDGQSGGGASVRMGSVVGVLLVGVLSAVLLL